MEKKRTKAQRIVIMLAILTLAVIWGNSMIPGDISEAFSEWFRQLLRDLFGMSALGEEGGGHLVRKLAHFTEYFVFGLEITYLCRKAGRVLFCGLMTAVIDETIQLFVPGRSSLVSDIWVDFAGFLVGAAVFVLIRKLNRHKPEKQTDISENPEDKTPQSTK